jgi:putative ABC transport system permease protein
VLSLLGGFAAVPLVVWLLSLFRALTPGQFALDVTLNGHVAAVSPAVCVLTGIIVGIMPARQALSLDVLPWLAGSGSVHTKPTRSTLRHAIMLPQVAVSLMLLLVAAVCVRGLLRIELADTWRSAPAA